MHYRETQQKKNYAYLLSAKNLQTKTYTVSRGSGEKLLIKGIEMYATVEDNKI